MNKKGFTLLELLVVISIIGLLSTIAGASVQSSREKARIAGGLQFAQTIHNGLGFREVGAWNLESISGGITNDTSGGKNIGVINGSPTIETGIVGNAMRFNGTTDYVEITATPELNIADKITISAWFLENSGTTGNRAIASKGFWSNIHVHLDANDNQERIYFAFDDTGSDTSLISSPIGSIFEDRWHHIVTQYDGISMKIFIDGHLSVEGPPNTPGALMAADIICPFRIGKNARDGLSTCTGLGNAGHMFFDGLIDDVHIYHESLSLSKIESLYTEGLKTHHLTKK